jgi:hypothetical protein
MHRKAVSHFLNGKLKSEIALILGIHKDTCYKLFEREDVKKEIERRQHQMSSKAGVDADWIIAKLKAIASADLADLITLDEYGHGRIDVDKLRGDLRTALNGYKVNRKGEVSVSLSDKLKALDMLARHLGMYQDKTTIEGELTLVERLQQGRLRASGSMEEGASGGEANKE